MQDAAQLEPGELSSDDLGYVDLVVLVETSPVFQRTVQGTVMCQASSLTSHPQE